MWEIYILLTGLALFTHLATAMVLRVDLFFFLLLLVHQVKSFLLVLKLGLHPDLAQRQMILKPLVLVLVIHEVG